MQRSNFNFSFKTKSYDASSERKQWENNPDVKSLNVGSLTSVEEVMCLENGFNIIPTKLF